MKPIRLTRHAVDQCAERGATEDEVYYAIEHGSREPAKRGRSVCRYNFAHDGMWQGKHYAIKQVAPVKEELEEVVVVTVYTFFF